MSDIVRNLESKYEKPLADILIDLYAQHKNLRKIANVLGVTQSTISYWLVKERLEIVPTLVRNTSYSLTNYGQGYVHAMRDQGGVVAESQGAK